LSNDYVKLASEIGRKVALLAHESKCHLKQEQQENDSRKAGIVRRAVDFPSLMLSIGFSSAFTFYLSKAGQDFSSIVSFFKYLTTDEFSENVCGELEKKEGVGYAGYIAILLFIMKKTGKSVEIEPDVKKAYSTLSALLDIADSLDYKYERKLLFYLHEVKKVLEALPL